MGYDPKMGTSLQQNSRLCSTFYVADFLSFEARYLLSANAE